MQQDIDYKFINTEIVDNFVPEYKGKDYFAIELQVKPYEGWLTVTEILGVDDEQNNLNLVCNIVGIPQDVDEDFVKDHVTAVSLIIQEIVTKKISEVSENLSTPETE